MGRRQGARCVDDRRHNDGQRVRGARVSWLQRTRRSGGHGRGGLRQGRTWNAAQPKAELKPRDPDWDAKVRASFARQTFMHTIGAHIASLSPGRCEVELPFRHDLCQQHGYLHGGVITAIAANAAGYAAFSLMPANSSVLGVEYKINLLGIGEGERFFARGAVLKPGRTLSVVRAG